MSALNRKSLEQRSRWRDARSAARLGICASMLLLVSTVSAAEDYVHAPAMCTICKSGPCCCPDDYCAKPLPPPPCIAGSCPDCYCPKPLPPGPPISCGCCDNYCAKPLICPPKLCEPWYTCGVPRRYCLKRTAQPGQIIVSEQAASPAIAR